MSAFQVSKVFNFFRILWPACLLMSSNCQISESVVETLDKEIHINIKRVDYINQTFCPAYLGMHYPSKFTPDSDVGESAVESPAVNDEGSMYVEEISNTGKNDKTLSQLFNDLYKLATDEEYGTNAELNIMKETTIDNILAFAFREADKVLASTELEDGEDSVDEELVNKTEGGYIYPKLTRINPGKVGDETAVELLPGRFTRRITRSVHPPIFEIPNFLSPEECFYIKQRALETGMNQSGVSGSDITEQIKDGRDIKDVDRLSETSTLRRSDIGELFHQSVVSRVASVTELPIEIIERSEDIQVARYEVGGHFHAHLDTADNVVLPCCFQSNECQKHITSYHTRAYTRCCRTCRYMSVLYYLNDVEEGGETAFPIADTCAKRYEFVRGPCQSVRTQVRKSGKRPDWMDLSRNCDKAALRFKPKMGTAIMWYSHFVDERTGYLGHVDEQSYHGGCDLLKGTKWIATSWIHTPPYKDRYRPSIYKEAT